MKYAIVLVLSLAMLIAACGGDDTDDAASAEPTATLAADLSQPTEMATTQESPAGAEPTEDTPSPIAEATHDHDHSDAASPTAGRTATAERATPEEADASPTGGSTANDDDENEASPEPQGVENDERLAEVVLTLDDVPAGWVPSPEEEDDDDANICDVEDVTDRYPDRPAARSAFEEDQAGPFVASFITDLGEDDADELITYVRDTFSACTTWTSTAASGTVSTFTPSEMALPDVGDDHYAVRLTGEVSGFQFVADLIYVRVDGFIIGLSHYGVDSIDSDMTTEWVETMIERVESLPES